MADILGIGTSGLLAYQRALTTTSHNISNVNTEGFSRQRTGLATRIPEYIGVGYAGSGVKVSDVSRNYDAFLTDQLRVQTANNERYSAFSALANQIDNMLADQNAGLGPMMDTFFAATQGVADNPNSIPARQVMLSSAESLADRFHYLDGQLRDLNSRVNQQLDAAVYEVNTLASGIAQLNEEIARARGAAAGADPNDLLDSRDLLLTKLSKLVDLQTVEQSDGMINVFIGTGQGLVVGLDTVQLGTRFDSLVEGKTRVVLLDGSEGVDVSRLLTGGKLGGTLEFSESILDESRNALGRIAVGISEQFNDLHRLGIDLNGDLGMDFFRDLKPAIFRSFVAGSGISGMPTVEYADVSRLTTKDYLLEYNGTNWTLSDYKTGQRIPFNSPAVIDGLRIDTSTIGGTPQLGDRFLIRPASEAARAFDVNITDPNQIAAAGGLQGRERMDPLTNMAVNAGTGQINSVTLLSQLSGPIAHNIELEYDGGDATALPQISPFFRVIVDGADVDSFSYVPGNTQTLNLIVDGQQVDVSFNISGKPQQGDVFEIANNTNAVGDNRNALALAALQTQKGMMNGTATYQTTYGQMVSRVGTQAHQASINKEATHTLRVQAETAVQSVSGVNLDEEAANIIRFQQAYQANAQVVSIANQLFQTLLQAF